MEDDVSAAREMADAVCSLLEAGASHRLDPRGVAAILRCVSHLQDHVGSTVRDWEEAVRASRAA